MILTELRTYLKLNKRMPLIDIANHFDVTPDAIKGMLELWIRKAKVRRIEGTTCSKGCCKADPAHLTIYEWID
jgi:hypothetical protein